MKIKNLKIDSGLGSVFDDYIAGGTTSTGNSIEKQNLVIYPSFADVGTELSVSLPTGYEASYYQWMRDGVDIEGETNSRYIFSVSDVGSTVTAKAYVAIESSSGVTYVDIDGVSYTTWLLNGKKLLINGKQVISGVFSV